jgi:protein arginine N-methyltransferase 3
MSFQISAEAIKKEYDKDDASSDPSSAEEDNKDLETWDDWVEEERPCKSLFDDTILPSAKLCIDHDRQIHDFDLLDFSAKLSQLPFLKNGRDAFRRSSRH